MKNRWHIIIMLALCFRWSVLADTLKLPTQEQATKLMAAVWKEPVQSIDITFYASIKEPDKSEHQIRTLVEDIFKDTHPLKEKLSPVMLEQRVRNVEMNVGRILKEQKIGRKMKVRIRIDDNRQRMDMVFGKPEVTIFAGTSHEERLPGKQLDSNTPFEMSNIDIIDKEGVHTHFEYLHESRTGTIRTEDGKTFKKSSILKLMGMPDEISLMLQRLLGKKENTSAGEVYLPDETKRNKLCSGTLDSISVKIFPDKDAPETNERIEISLADEKSTTLKTIMVCDKKYYSKVYYYEFQNATANLPILTRLCSNFDPNGFPHNSTEIKYNDKGNIKRETTHRIESVRLNIPIPNEVFEFSPPKDYAVRDFRLTLAERQAAEITRLKGWLGHKVWTYRLRALVGLEQHLRDNPAELRDIATSMFDDENPVVRKQASKILQRIGSSR